MRAGLISESSIKAALTEARGIFSWLRVRSTVPRGNLISTSGDQASCKGFAASIEQIKRDPAYDKMSAEQFENEVATLSRSFKLDGLNEIHKLAMMEYGDSAALAKVKLDAARSLRGGDGHTGHGGEVEATLMELNQLYQANAPRIREIRTTVVTLSDEITLNHAPSRLP